MLALLSFGMAGCQTTSQLSVPLTTVTVPEEIAIAPPAPLLPLPQAPPTAPSAILHLPSSHVLPSSPRATWPTNWVNAWVPLEDWGQIQWIGQTNSGVLGARTELPVPYH